MPVYRYKFSGVDVADLKAQVPPADAPSISGGAIGATVLWDVTAPATSKADLDAYFASRGWAFDSQDPVDSPAEAAAGDLSHLDLTGIGINPHTTIDSHIASVANPHATTAAQVGAIPTSEKGAALGVATLDAGTKIPAAQIPAVALPEVHVVADAAARLALTVQEGDEAIQIDDGSHWIFDGTSWFVRPGFNADVTGPASATDNAIARFDGATGKLIQDSLVTITDTGSIALPVGETVDGEDVSTLAPSRKLRVFASRRVSGLNTFQTTDGTAYWVYLGRMDEDVMIDFVRARVTTGGSGAQTAEVALASTPLAPNGANQTLTKIAASGSVTSLTSSGLKANTSALNANVVKGTHLWAGIRTSMGAAEPTFSSLERDMTRGELMSTAAAGALTGAGPWTGVPMTDAAGQSVELRVSVD